MVERDRAPGHRARALARAADRWRRTAGEVVRREGFGRLLARAWVVARGAVYRHVELFVIELSEPRGESPSGLPLEMRFLEPGDLEAYARLRARPVDAVSASRRLEAGHLGLAAWLDGELVSAVWYAAGRAWIDEIDRELVLGPHALYSYDSYTAEALRGRSIATVRGRWAVEQFRSRGLGYIIGWISPANRPALGPALKLGATSLGRAGFVRLGPFRRNFIAPAGGKRRWSSPPEPIDFERDFAEALAARPVSR